MERANLKIFGNFLRVQRMKNLSKKPKTLAQHYCGDISWEHYLADQFENFEDGSYSCSIFLIQLNYRNALLLKTAKERKNHLVRLHLRARPLDTKDKDPSSCDQTKEILQKYSQNEEHSP